MARAYCPTHKTPENKKIKMINFYDAKFKVTTQKDQFLKLKEGANKVRFLPDHLVCYEIFVEVLDEKQQKKIKPLRKTEPFTAEELSQLVLKDKKEKAKLTLIQLVYDYSGDDFKFLSMNQNSLLNALKEYSQNPDYGNPANYDITISKKGQNLETVYTFMPSPPKPLDKVITKRSKNLNFDLTKLLNNEYPADNFPFEKKEVSELNENPQN